MTTCARCNAELPRSRVHVDGREYHLECHRTEADWREIDRLAEARWIHGGTHWEAYDNAERFIAERKRRRET